MTRISRLLLAALLALGAGGGHLSTARADFVVLNRDIARSYASDELFLTDATDVLSDASWLQSYRAGDATNGGFSIVPCTEVASEDCGSSTASVVVGISSCLADATISKIKTWIGQVKPAKLTYRADDANTELKLTFVLYTTVCANAANTSKYKSISRLSGFSTYGSVASAMPTKAPVALIAFAKDANAYNGLHAYAKSWSVPFVYTFQVNELTSGNAATRFTNAIYLSKIAELTAESYAPFRTVTPFACASVLANSRAFAFYDSSGSKQCLCTCPSGYEMVETTANRRTTQSCQKLSNPSPPSNATIGTCIWDAFGPFKFDVTDELAVCSLPEVLASSGLAVPRLMTTDIDDGKSAADPTRTVTLSAAPVLSPIYSGDEVATALCSQQRASGSCDRDAVLKRRPLRLPTGSYSKAQNPSSSNAAQTTSKCSWTTYQQDPSSLFATLAFPGYGKYKLVASAADSRHKGSCTGCVVVVDQYRPRATSACPSTICEPSSVGVGATASVPSSLMFSASSVANAELTVANVCKANAAVQQVLAFQDRAANDACSSSISGTTPRCDDELVQVRSFFANTDALSNTSSRLSDGRDCFAPARVWADFLNAVDAQKALFADAKTLQMDAPVSSSSAGAAKCSRCCRLRVQLKEKWVDYLCDATYDTERCDGLESEQCAYAQCLTITGRSALTASAQVRTSVKSETDSVLKELASSSGSALASSNEIHRALSSCSALGTANNSAACLFTASVSDLIDTSAAFHTDWTSYALPASGYNSAKPKDPNTFVFWRYRIVGDSGGWRRLSDGASHAFTQSATPITLEAWSQCGIVRSFAFSVHLHVHTAIRVCESFDAMWYQSMTKRAATPTKATLDAVLCNVPKSDFVELTFDFHSGIGLGESPNARAGTSSLTLRTAVSSVVCSASLDARTSAEILRVSSAPSFEIVRRFAVQLPRTPTTTSRADLQLQCTFTYTKYDRSTTALSCSKRVVLQDCDAPCFDASLAGSCSATACSTKNALPGLYEACASSVITATATQTQLVNASSECCQACAGVMTACTPLVALPCEASVLSRCEPQLPPATAYTRAVAYVTQLAVRTTSASSVLRDGAALVSAAGVLVAAVALAVAASRTQRQKRAQQATASEQEALSASAKEVKDAYFRLAKTLHPDVTGNDKAKAELFKNVSEAHSVLSDVTRRRQYDAARPAQSFHAQSTGGGRMHPYAAQAAAEAAARGYDPNRTPDFTARRMYGIDEEVWIAHHYGGHTRRSSMPGRYYGMNIVEERMEAEEERIRRRKQHYKLHASAGYALRREARLKKRAAEDAAARARGDPTHDSNRSKDGSDDENANCVIS